MGADGGCGAGMLSCLVATLALPHDSPILCQPLDSEADAGADEHQRC